MRLHSDKDRHKGIAPELVDAGCELIEQFTLTGKKNDYEDYRLGEIVQSCFNGERGAAVMVSVCRALKSAVAQHGTSAIYHDDLLVALFGVQPMIALDSICGGDQKELDHGVRILEDVSMRKNPLSIVSDQDLIRWCDQDPQLRYPGIARIIPIDRRTRDSEPPRWTTIALRFLEKAPDPKAMLHQFTLRFVSGDGWSGSRATPLESQTRLLDQLRDYPELTATVSQESEWLRKWIEEERRRETAWYRHLDERFE
jgi:hypothetical protein